MIKYKTISIMLKKSEFWQNVFCGIFGIMIFGGVLLMIVSLSLTVQTVNQKEYAVGYDNYTMEFTKIYTQGQSVTRIGEYLIILPRTIQEYEAKLSCLTKDKVLVLLDVGMQYQYDKSELINTILRKFNGKKNFNTFITNRATSSIMDTCLKYNAEDFYTKRGNIDITMYNTLVSVINNDNIGANVEFFQLINIEFPPTFSSAIVKKQTVQQEALTATNNRQSILTNAKTMLYEAQRTAAIISINANNTALITLNKAYADANAQVELWKKRSYAYNYTATVLGLNGSAMVDYIESENVKKSSTLITSN